jgi:hypothetical protein
MIKRHGKITIAFMLLLSLTSTAFAFFPRTKEVQIDKTAQWLFAPSVRVCHTSPLSVHEVANALKWWKDLGYEFDWVYDDACQNIIKYGTITIMLDRGELLMNDLLGRTTFYSDPESGNISWTIIELRAPYVDRVLEHEIGHALGWMHARVDGHMMHPIHYQGGWDLTGLSN